MRRNNKESSWCLCAWVFLALLALLLGTKAQICSIPSSRVPCKRLLIFIYFWIDVTHLQNLLWKPENNYLRKFVLLYTPKPEVSWALIHEWLMSTWVDFYAPLLHFRLLACTSIPLNCTWNMIIDCWLGAVKLFVVLFLPSSSVYSSPFLSPCIQPHLP